MFKKKKYTVIRQAISKDLAAFVANYFLMQKQVYDTCRATRYISPFENIIGHYEGPVSYTHLRARDRQKSRMPSSA